MIAAAEEQLLMEVSNSPRICHLIELKNTEAKPKSRWDFVSFRYPLPLDNVGDRARVGMSLSAFYQYPVHSCLVALRKMIKASCSGEDTGELGPEATNPQSKLVR